MPRESRAANSDIKPRITLEGRSAHAYIAATTISLRAASMSSYETLPAYARKRVMYASVALNAGRSRTDTTVVTRETSNREISDKLAKSSEWRDKEIVTKELLLRREGAGAVRLHKQSVQVAMRYRARP